VRIRTSLLVAVAIATLALATGTAAADTPGKVTVLGPIEVSESGLFANVIEPQFEAAFPQYELIYTPSAQNTAATNAETGTGGPSVLLLHEPALESKFVAGGFSYEDRFGSALFYTDYVLAGSTTDVAGVGSNAPHDIARAFADVASSGIAGEATFDSRGGTNTASTTTILEHAVWKLVSESGLAPAGLSLCDVTAADGGGMTPITAAALSSDPQAPTCPSADGGIAGGADLPAWYRIISGNLANNVLQTNNCTGTTNSSTNCYALSDRGTFNFLASGRAPAGTITNLSVLSAGQSASAPGGPSILLVRLDGYVIDPAKPGEAVNLAGAQALVGFLTSPAEQAQIGDYLKTVPKSPGAPFVPDAIPSITASPSAAAVLAGSPVMVSGAVADPEPGYPGLSGRPVIVRAADGAQVGSGLLDASDHFSLSFVPPAGGTYQVTTPAIARLITPAPPFGDTLGPASSAPFSVAVTAPPASPSLPRRGPKSIRIEKAASKKGTVTVSGKLDAPSVGRATVSLQVERIGPLAKKKPHDRQASASKSKKPHFKTIASEPVKPGATTVTIEHQLAPGFRYSARLSYRAPDGSTLTSAPRHVTVR